MELSLRARCLSVVEPTMTGAGEANAIEESRETVIARGRVSFILVETVAIGKERGEGATTRRRTEVE